VKKILVIESGEEKNGIQNILNSAEYTIYQSANEIDGVKIAYCYLPDMIICNVEPPEKELKIVQKLNDNPVTETIPLIMISSCTKTFHYRKIMEAGADDFLNKPVECDFLLNSISRRFRKINALKEKMLTTLTSGLTDSDIKQKGDDHILVKIGNKLRLVEFSKIICITALKEYSKIYTENAQKIIVRKSIRNWLDILPAQDFLRIHRATVVNIHYIDKIEKTGFRSYSVYIKTIPNSFPLSQRFANAMRKTFSL
jgi:DNA-binding LytR/AlgR family response regulator